MKHAIGFRSGLEAALVAAACLAMASAVHASPITLKIGSDTPFEMKGAVTGRLNDTVFVADSFHFPDTFGYHTRSTLDLGSSGKNWNVTGNFFENFNYDNSNHLMSASYGLTLHGQHLVAPHPGEVVPGLEMLVYADNVSGEAVAPLRSPATRFHDSKPHLASTHWDDMTLTLSDLNGAGAGVIGDGQFAASFVLTHPIPEPGTYAMFLGGLGILAFAARRTRAA